ncbi:MAG: NF038130 family PEP-CTERM protein [Microcoleaceae cyanobacterium MO_207.B10]|nr:NF038130 family PEP-CTERM protein [Microcoleaceae cyanobacterium MO_207.B10]
MLGLTKKFLISTSVVAGMSAVVGAPVMAAGFRTSGNNLIYQQVGNQTIVNGDNSLDFLSDMSDMGNIEVGNVDAEFGPVGSIEGTFSGKTFTARNATAADWFTTTSGVLDNSFGAENLANEWWGGLYQEVETNKSSYLTLFTTAGGTEEDLYNIFLSQGGFERASDANITYMNANGKDMEFWTLGHYDMDQKYGDAIENAMVGYVTQKMPFLNTLAVQNAVDGILTDIQASEMLIVDDGSNTYNLYSFLAEESEVTAADDGVSHSGLYKHSITGVISPEEPKKVPEPSAMLGLMAVGSLLAASKSNSQKKA